MVMEFFCGNVPRLLRPPISICCNTHTTISKIIYLPLDFHCKIIPIYLETFWNHQMKSYIFSSRFWFFEMDCTQSPCSVFKQQQQIFFKVFSLEKSCFSRVAQKIHQNVAILALPTFGTKLPVVDVRPCDELRFKKDKLDKLAESWTGLTFHGI